MNPLLQDKPSLKNAIDALTTSQEALQKATWDVEPVDKELNEELIELMRRISSVKLKLIDNFNGFKVTAP